MNAGTERLWCRACGTVTRDMRCDCNRWPDGHEMKREPHFVNYADAMQEAAHEQAQQIDALVKALQKIADLPPSDKAVRPVKDHRRIAIAALASIKETSK